MLNYLIENDDDNVVGVVVVWYYVLGLCVHGTESLAYFLRVQNFEVENVTYLW